MNDCEVRDSSANGGFHPNKGDWGHAPGRKRCWRHFRGHGSPPGFLCVRQLISEFTTLLLDFSYSNQYQLVHLYLIPNATKIISASICHDLFSVFSWNKDHSGGACDVKLYVSPVPRTVTETEIRSLFDGHGTISEVVLLKDKRHGGQQGSCFVKYTNLDGAERAIRALCNQYMFPGEACSITVKYADGERERLGVIDKVFVNGFHREASKEQIEEIFSPYGHIEEIFICRNELKQSRGYGFVQFSHRDMAQAAIDGLHEKFIMPGCSQPLIVRLADPKKPKTGDLRGNHASTNGYAGLCSWEQLPRQAPIYSDLPGGVLAPTHSTVLQSQLAIHLENSPSTTGVMQQTLQPKHSLPRWPPEPLPPMQKHMGSHPAADEMQRQSNQIDMNAQNMDQLQYSQMASSSPVLATGVIQDVTVTSQTGNSPKCDWSEHTCPDGYKYYYNCITCESRWEKPEEYVFYEQQIRKQEHVPKPDHQFQSPLPLLSPQQCAQTQKEAESVQLQPETSSVIGPACC